MSPAERMRRYRARLKAKSGITDARAGDRSPRTCSAQAVAGARSLAMHVRIVSKINRDPSLLAIARANLNRWTEHRPGATPPAHAEWQEILCWEWDAIAALLLEQSEKAVRLRQSTPFTGILHARERWAIHETFRS
jgi:hypothetical protein